jgi:hypothetical protein
MSGVGQWRVALQGMPEYETGMSEFAAGVPIQDLAQLHDVNHGDRYEALKLGWRDAEDETRPRYGEP